MIYDVQFPMEAAAELLRVSEVVGSAVSILRAAEAIHHRLENDPAEQGEFLSEGLYYIDEEPLRAFLMIDVESVVVEVTDFRII